MKKRKFNISKERHCQELESIGSVIMPIIKNAFSAEDLVESDIMCNWIDIIGEETASFCSPLKVRYLPKESCRTLYVEVPAGGFALELQHRETYILEKINAYFGYQAVHKINISQNIKKIPKFLIPKKQKEEKKIELNENEKKYLNELSDGIKDEKLKEILTKLGQSVIISNRGEKDDV